MDRTFVRRATAIAGALVLAAALATITRQPAPKPRAPTHVAGEQVATGAPAYGSLSALPNQPVVAITPTPSEKGYWLVGADGGVFTFGDAPFEGSTGGMPLAAPIVDLVPAGTGYWLVARDGGVFSFGGARFLGSMGGVALVAPIVAGFGSPSGHGYSLVAADGGVFTFGDAPFLGSLGGAALVAPIVDAQGSASGGGYTMVAADGGVFTFGDAPFAGSLGGVPLVAPIAAIAPTDTGYRLVARDGGVFAFGAPFFGSLGGYGAGAPVVAGTSAPGGYWLLDESGRVHPFDRTTTPKTPGGPIAAGPSNPAALRHVGPLTITRDNELVENVDVAGEIHVAASNVTIRNFRANNVMKDPGRVGLTLADGEIHGAFDPLADGVAWSDYVAIRLDVHHVFDAFKAMGNVVIDSCYVHDLNFFTGGNAGAGGYSHNDAVQISSGANVVIRNSRLVPKNGNSSVFIDADQGPIDNVWVTNNVIGGGGISLYSIRSRSAPQYGRPTNVVVANNVFTRQHLFDYATIAPSGTAWSNNVNDLGAPIAPRIDDLS